MASCPRAVSPPLQTYNDGEGGDPRFPGGDPRFPVVNPVARSSGLFGNRASTNDDLVNMFARAFPERAARPGRAPRPGRYAGWYAPANSGVQTQLDYPQIRYGNAEIFEGTAPGPFAEAFPTGSPNARLPAAEGRPFAEAYPTDIPWSLAANDPRVPEPPFARPWSLDDPMVPEPPASPPAEEPFRDDLEPIHTTSRPGIEDLSVRPLVESDTAVVQDIQRDMDEELASLRIQNNAKGLPGPSTGPSWNRITEEQLREGRRTWRQDRVEGAIRAGLVRERQDWAEAYAKTGDPWQGVAPKKRGVSPPPKNLRSERAEATLNRIAQEQALYSTSRFGHERVVAEAEMTDLGDGYERLYAEEADYYRRIGYEGAPERVVDQALEQAYNDGSIFRAEDEPFLPDSTTDEIYRRRYRIFNPGQPRGIQNEGADVLTEEEATAILEDPLELEQQRLDEHLARIRAAAAEQWADMARIEAARHPTRAQRMAGGAVGGVATVAASAAARRVNKAAGIDAEKAGQDFGSFIGLNLDEGQGQVITEAVETGAIVGAGVVGVAAATAGAAAAAAAAPVALAGMVAFAPAALASDDAMKALEEDFKVEREDVRAVTGGAVAAGVGGLIMMGLAGPEVLLGAGLLEVTGMGAAFGGGIHYAQKSGLLNGII